MRHLPAEDMVRLGELLTHPGQFCLYVWCLGMLFSFFFHLFEGVRLFWLVPLWPLEVLQVILCSLGGKRRP